MDTQNQSPLDENSDNSLEEPQTGAEPVVSETGTSPEDKATLNGETLGTPLPPKPEPPTAPHNHLKEKLRSLNIYLLLFIFLLLVSGVIVFFVVYNAPKNTVSNQTSPQSLSASQLEQLAGSSQTIGNSSQVLNIGANSIFNGQVLVQKDLSVAGNIKIGGSLNLPGISVAGGAKFAQIQTNKLSVSGATTLSGQLVSSSGIDIAGASTFSGALSVATLNVQNLQLTSNLTINNHIQTGGNRPTRTTGSAVGSGGTTSISGSDTSGTISINTGSSPGTGCFVSVSFARNFSSTPHVVITPVGAAAGSLEYYVNRSASGFSVCTDSAPSSGQSFAFDYMVLD